MRNFKVNCFLNHFVVKFFSILLMIFSISCIDREFDEPPVKEHVIPFTANSSIAYLKSLYQTGKFINISDDLTIVATVIADDRSGNFYKTLVVQDSTAGIEIKVNRTGLYATFPVGSRIGIRCKGLTIGDYAGLIQMGQGTYQDGGFTRLSGIEDVVSDKYLFPGPRGQYITPSVRTINSLTSFDLSTLILLQNLEFDRSSVGQGYADATGQNSVNHTLMDCNDNTILLRTSGFADFAGISVPELNGTVVAVLGTFNNDMQLFIRDTSDVRMNNPICNGGGPGIEDRTVLEIRQLFKGVNTTVSENVRIRGVVTSDRQFANINGRNLFIQDSTAGILIRFSSNHTFNLGDNLEINLRGVELSDFNGLLQVNNVSNSNAKVISTGNSLVPGIIKIGDLLKDFEKWESRLIQIRSAKLSKSSGQSYDGNVTVTDATGSVTLFTTSVATFANSVFPADSVNITALVSQFNAPQILIRNTTDVQPIQGGGGQGATLVSIREVRNLFSGTKSEISSDWKIKGSVSSDRSGVNIVGQNLYIQDSTAAILVRFNSNHLFDLGDELEIVIKASELSEFNQLLQLNNVPLANAKLIRKNVFVTPREFTIKQILDNGEDLEGQLVLIRNVDLSKSSGSTYSGTVILNDGTGVLDLFTRSQAVFSSSSFPLKASSITGNISQFNNRQLILRNESDVKP